MFCHCFDTFFSTLHHAAEHIVSGAFVRPDLSIKIMLSNQWSEKVWEPGYRPLEWLTRILHHGHGIVGTLHAQLKYSVRKRYCNGRAVHRTSHILFFFQLRSILDLSWTDENFHRRTAYCLVFLEVWGLSSVISSSTIRLLPFSVDHSIRILQDYIGGI